ncbi:ATP-grasp domain-containing protein [Chamaesiphon sp. VAR_48_metabat_403]|uniref:ATP-grasp domain-containing protein n=1 Tax=Chamaesiphon sp. VAR_48_metabat_403 TaxID=2964700 RepID=UPI00286E2059|nr:ATP-grasp domain-containing protein [Chamaesiphon sp. VAR_48_metabat_403]
MKVYILQNSDEQFATIECGVAYYGFKLLGWEIIPFQSLTAIADFQPGDLVVGRILDINIALELSAVARPLPLDYPPELRQFLGRKIWQSTIDDLVASSQWGIFIKPATECKKFTGRAILNSQDLIKCGDLFDGSQLVWCAELVEFRSEWRCFVRYNKILGVHLYQGDWRLAGDPQVIEAAVAAYTSAPTGYAIDFGVTSTGETLVIEVNDGYALGNYGLPPIYYAQLLSARWAELTDTEDYGITLSEVFEP